MNAKNYFPPAAANAFWRSGFRLSPTELHAGIAVRWETERRPEPLRSPELRLAQLQKIEAACDFIEQDGGMGGPPDIGQIALATTLSWIAFRNIYAFEENRPHLTSWYNNFCRRPSMAATPLSGATVD